MKTTSLSSLNRKRPSGMEEAQKMEALKKAYADIILHTAKEAAARLMVSERKALRFQQDLFAAKEEALNMLLRLKQIMDSKIAEAEIRSLCQQRRIEELEMQLHEAEEIVRDLRTELIGLQDELEVAKNNPLQPLDEQIVKENATFPEDTSQKHLNTSGIGLCPLDSGCRTISTCDMKNNPLLNQRVINDKCCFVLENATTQIECSSDSPTENYYTSNPDLASIIMRSKEPELYKNGCTQRIRAFEGNLLDSGKLPLPSQADDHCLHIKTGSISREDEKVEGACIVASPKSDNMGIAEKNLSALEITQHDSSSGNGQAMQFFCRFSKRKRVRYRKRKPTSFSSLTDQVMKTPEPSFLSRFKTYPYPVNSNDGSGDCPSSIIEDEPHKDSDSCMDRSGCMDGTGSEARIIKAGSVENVTNKDMTLMDDSVLTSQESKAAESSGVLDCGMNSVTVDVPSINSNTKEAQACERTTATPTQAVNKKPLKYTFQRKRKRESISGPDDNASLEKNILKSHKSCAGDNESSVSEPQKSSLIMESSRDSRRLVQVARQLISLSEKRWW